MNLRKPQWTRDLPRKEGWYWLCEDHWSDGHPEIVRVFESFDHFYLMMRNGAEEPERLPHPSYWMRIKTPKFNIARIKE